MIIGIIKKYAVKTLLMAMACLLPHGLNALDLNPIIVKPIEITLITYSINYDYDNGYDFSNSNPIAYTPSQLPITLKTAKKTYYDFSNYKIEYKCLYRHTHMVGNTAYNYYIRTYQLTGREIKKDLSNWTKTSSIDSNITENLPDCTDNPKGTIHVKALYAPTSYKITLNPQNGTVSTSGWTKDGTAYTKTYNIESATFTLPTPTRTNYKFKGWCTSSSGCTTPTTKIEKGSYGHKTFYAQWEANQIMFSCGSSISNLITPKIIARSTYPLNNVATECMLPGDARDKYICGSVNKNSSGGYSVVTSTLVVKSVGENAPLSGLTFCAPAMLINNQYYHWFRPAQNTDETSSDYQKPQIWTAYSPAGTPQAIQISNTFKTTLKNAVGSNNGNTWFTYNIHNPTQKSLSSNGFNPVDFFKKTNSIIITWGYPITIHCENGVNNNIAWPKNATVRGESYNALIAGLCDYGNTTGQDAPLYCTTSNTEYILQPDNTPIGGEVVITYPTNTTTTTGPNGEPVQSYFNGTADCWWKYYCAPKTYLPKNKRTCSWCTANNYCTGGSYPYSDTVAKGLTPCPQPFGYSTPMSRSASECFAEISFHTGESKNAPVTFRGTEYTYNESTVGNSKLWVYAYSPTSRTGKASCYDTVSETNWCKSTLNNYYMTYLPWSKEISRPGYTLNGWNYCDGTTNDKISTCSDLRKIYADSNYAFLTKRTYLIADWYLIPYTIIKVRKNADGTKEFEQSQKYDIEHDLVLDDWSKDGYSFKGWCGPYNVSQDTLPDECLPSAVDVSPKQSEYEPIAIPAGTTTGTRHFLAAYAPITYTVKFDKNAEDATGNRGDKTCTYDEPCSIAGVGPDGDTDFELYGKELFGWSTDSTKTPNDDLSTDFYTDTDKVFNLANTQTEVTLYAIWADEDQKYCKPGTYYDPSVDPATQGAEKCTICDKDSWCPGTSYLNGDTEKKGITPCPTDYVTESTGAKSRSECYKIYTSTCANVDGATTLPANSVDTASETTYYEEDDSATPVNCKKFALSQAEIDAGGNDTDVATCKLINPDGTVCIQKKRCRDADHYEQVDGRCTPLTITCDTPGYYLKAGKIICDTPCENGFYCPGNGTYPYNPDNNQGRNECPPEFPESEALSDDAGDCYTNTCTVNFDANGGSGTIESVPCTLNEVCDLPQAGFSRTNYEMDGWLDTPASSDEPSTSKILSTCPETGETTVYAHWVPVCSSNKYLHIGADEPDKNKMCLYQELTGSPKLAVMIGNDKYYANMSRAVYGNPISKTSNKKLHIMYNDKIYNVHDLTGEATSMPMPADNGAYSGTASSGTTHTDTGGISGRPLCIAGVSCE